MSARLIKSVSGQAFDLAPLAIPVVGASPEHRNAQSSPAHARIRSEANPFAPHHVASTNPAVGRARVPGAAYKDETSARTEAEKIIAGATLEAESLIRVAQTRVDEIEREAHERGMQTARACADEELRDAVEPLRAQLLDTIDELSNLRAQIAARAEADIIQLAIEMAKKIVHREVSVDREIALALVRVSLSRLHSRAAAVVHLHPEDFAYINSHRTRLELGGSIELAEDRSVGLGGCLVRTEMGDVDARVEQQFAEVERGLMNL